MLHRIAAGSVMVIVLLVCGSTSDQAVGQEKKGPTAQQVSESLLPEGIDPAQTSDDPTYAYTQDNPVKVGSSDSLGGPKAEKVYLSHLRDAYFKPFRFRRIEKRYERGPDGHILDLYELTDSMDKTHMIYIDMYHPESNPLTCKAPKGMYFCK